MGAWGGLCWRYVPRGAQPLNVGHIFQASGRWNRRGEYGALYLAATQAGALAERSRYLAFAGVNPATVRHDLVSVHVELHHWLDLTAPGILRRYGVSIAALTAADHAVCHRTADLARAANFFALRVPSAALAGACNIIIYPDAYPVATIALRDGPDRIAL